MNVATFQKWESLPFRPAATTITKTALKEQNGLQLPQYRAHRPRFRPPRQHNRRGLPGGQEGARIDAFDRLSKCCFFWPRCPRVLRIEPVPPVDILDAYLKLPMLD